MSIGALDTEGDVRNLIRQVLDQQLPTLIQHAQASGTNNAFSPGDVKAAAYSTPGTGWLACDGSVVATATYPELSAALGGSWNTGGEGAGNFRLPDFRGRSLVGVGTGAGLTARALAALFGAETHTLSALESGLPAHGHSASSSVSDPGHAHGPGNGGSAIVTDGSSDGTANVTVGSNAFHRTPVTGSATTGVSVSTTVGNASAAAASAGHNNMQPSVGVSYFVKT